MLLGILFFLFTRSHSSMYCYTSEGGNCNGLQISDDNIFSDCELLMKKIDESEEKSHVVYLDNEVPFEIRISRLKFISFSFIGTSEDSFVKLCFSDEISNGYVFSFTDCNIILSTDSLTNNQNNNLNSTNTKSFLWKLEAISFNPDCYIYQQRPDPDFKLNLFVSDSIIIGTSHLYEMTTIYADKISIYYEPPDSPFGKMSFPHNTSFHYISNRIEINPIISFVQSASSLNNWIIQLVFEEGISISFDQLSVVFFMNPEKTTLIKYSFLPPMFFVSDGDTSIKMQFFFNFNTNCFISLISDYFIYKIAEMHMYQCDMIITANIYIDILDIQKSCYILTDANFDIGNYFTLNGDLVIEPTKSHFMLNIENLEAKKGSFLIKSQPNEKLEKHEIFLSHLISSKDVFYTSEDMKIENYWKNAVILHFDFILVHSFIPGKAFVFVNGTVSLFSKVVGIEISMLPTPYYAVDVNPFYVKHLNILSDGLPIALHYLYEENLNQLFRKALMKSLYKKKIYLLATESRISHCSAFMTDSYLVHEALNSFLEKPKYFKVEIDAFNTTIPEKKDHYRYDFHFASKDNREENNVNANENLGLNENWGKAKDAKIESVKYKPNNHKIKENFENIKENIEENNKENFKESVNVKENEKLKMENEYFFNIMNRTIMQKAGISNRILDFFEEKLKKKMENNNAISNITLSVGSKQKQNRLTIIKLNKKLFKVNSENEEPDNFIIRLHKILNSEEDYSRSKNQFKIFNKEINQKTILHTNPKESFSRVYLNSVKSPENYSIEAEEKKKYFSRLYNHFFGSIKSEGKETLLHTISMTVDKVYESEEVRFCIGEFWNEQYCPTNSYFIEGGNPTDFTSEISNQTKELDIFFIYHKTDEYVMNLSLVKKSNSLSIRSDFDYGNLYAIFNENLCKSIEKLRIENIFILPHNDFSNYVFPSGEKGIILENLTHLEILDAYMDRIYAPRVDFLSLHYRQTVANEFSEMIKNSKIAQITSLEDFDTIYYSDNSIVFVDSEMNISFEMKSDIIIRNPKVYFFSILKSNKIGRWEIRKERVAKSELLSDDNNYYNNQVLSNEPKKSHNNENDQNMQNSENGKYDIRPNTNTKKLLQFMKEMTSFYFFKFFNGLTTSKTAQTSSPTLQTAKLNNNFIKLENSAAGNFDTIGLNLKVNFTDPISIVGDFEKNIFTMDVNYSNLNIDITHANRIPVFFNFSGHVFATLHVTSQGNSSNEIETTQIYEENNDIILKDSSNFTIFTSENVKIEVNSRLQISGGSFHSNHPRRLTVNNINVTNGGFDMTEIKGVTVGKKITMNPSSFMLASNTVFNATEIEFHFAFSDNPSKVYIKRSNLPSKLIVHHISYADELLVKSKKWQILEKKPIFCVDDEDEFVLLSMGNVFDKYPNNITLSGILENENNGYRNNNNNNNNNNIINGNNFKKTDKIKRNKENYVINNKINANENKRNNNFLRFDNDKNNYNFNKNDIKEMVEERLRQIKIDLLTRVVYYGTEKYELSTSIGSFIDNKKCIFIHRTEILPLSKAVISVIVVGNVLILSSAVTLFIICREKRPIARITYV